MQTPGYDGHQSDIVFQPVGGLQKAIFYPATRFDDFMENFDLPTTTIPLNNAQRIFKITDKCVGQEQPLNGFMSEFSQIFRWMFFAHQNSLEFYSR